MRAAIPALSLTFLLAACVDNRGGPSGSVAMEFCLLVSTTPPGANWHAANQFADVQAIWGEFRDVDIAIDMSGMLD